MIGYLLNLKMTLLLNNVVFLTLYRARSVFEIVFFRVWCGSPWYFFFSGCGVAPHGTFFSPMFAKLIGPNLDLQFLKKIHFLDEVIVFDHLPCKG